MKIFFVLSSKWRKNKGNNAAMGWRVVDSYRNKFTQLCNPFDIIWTKIHIKCP